tara:strand:- start:463 stop:705 length:243 start_codon:yes stop_codon:yes gene_type:complete
MDFTYNKLLLERAACILELIKGCEERAKTWNEYAINQTHFFWTIEQSKRDLSKAHNYNMGALRLRKAYRKTIAKLNLNAI